MPVNFCAHSVSQQFQGRAPVPGHAVECCPRDGHRQVEAVKGKVAHRGCRVHVARHPIESHRVLETMVKVQSLEHHSPRSHHGQAVMAFVMALPIHQPSGAVNQFGSTPGCVLFRLSPKVHSNWLESRDRAVGTPAKNPYLVSHSRACFHRSTPRQRRRGRRKPQSRPG